MILSRVSSICWEWGSWNSQDYSDSSKKTLILCQYILKQFTTKITNVFTILISGLSNPQMTLDMKQFPPTNYKQVKKVFLTCQSTYPVFSLKCYDISVTKLWIWVTPQLSSLIKKWYEQWQPDFVLFADFIFVSNQHDSIKYFHEYNNTAGNQIKIVFLLQFFNKKQTRLKLVGKIKVMHFWWVKSVQKGQRQLRRAAELDSLEAGFNSVYPLYSFFLSFYI